MHREMMIDVNLSYAQVNGTDESKRFMCIRCNET